MTQKDQVVEAMHENGGYATFEQLNRLLDFSSWKTKTPQASVRKIVQVNAEFFRIEPGLWALTERKKEILKKFDIETRSEKKQNAFTHSYYQGLLVEAGNVRGFQTYIPNQDRRKLFLDKPLGEISTIGKIYEFTYPEITRQAKTVDTIWFNERNLPDSLFEVEHSTDFKNSLLKYYELQDFAASFYIVAPAHRYRQFEEISGRSIFKPIRKRVQYLEYEKVAAMYERASLQRIYDE